MVVKDCSLTVLFNQYSLAGILAMIQDHTMDIPRSPKARHWRRLNSGNQWLIYLLVCSPMDVDNCPIIRRVCHLVLRYDPHVSPPFTVALGSSTIFKPIDSMQYFSVYALINKRAVSISMSLAIMLQPQETSATRYLFSFITTHHPHLHLHPYKPSR